MFPFDDVIMVGPLGTIIMTFRSLVKWLEILVYSWVENVVGHIGYSRAEIKGYRLNIYRN